MDENVIFFTLFYLICSLCFIFRTSEFVSAGLSVEHLLNWYLGKEEDDFILYHIRRTSCTLFVHSSLLLGYRLSISWVLNYPYVEEGLTFFNIVGTLSLILPVISTITLRMWRKNNWETHPIAQRLRMFCHGNTTWRYLASDINLEIRRLLKIKIVCSSLEYVFVTQNWIFKVTPYNVYCARQNFATLSIDGSDSHSMSATGMGSAQFLNIRVSFTSRGEVHRFYIRLNALSFKDFEENVRIPIVVSQNIVFHRSRAEQFLEVFREHVLLNPPYLLTEEVEMCIGCLVNSSDVKLVKQCLDEGPNPCGNCYCLRPLWCLSCMGRWFAARQEEEHPEQWLSSKCMCPLCRTTFCILDVCPVRLEVH